jgi:hypothetical protein
LSPVELAPLKLAANFEYQTETEILNRRVRAA